MDVTSKWFALGPMFGRAPGFLNGMGLSGGTMRPSEYLLNHTAALAPTNFHYQKIL